MVGGDVVEVSPPYDTTGATAIAGAHVAMELICLWGLDAAVRRLLVFVVALLLGSWLGLRVAQGPSGTPLPATESQRAAATAYLEANFAAHARGLGMVALLRPEPGIELEVGRASAAGEARGTLVYVPGYTAPLDMYGAEFARLTGAGWTVAAISPRGQGRSTRRGPDPQMGWIDDHATHAADLAAFLGRSTARWA